MTPASDVFSGKNSARRSFEDVSIIVPAHNEAHRIASRLRGLCSTVVGAEIIVVANNCSDRTEDVVFEIAREFPQVKLIAVPFQIGKGGAIRVGFQIAKRSIIAFVDADESTSGTELCRLIEQLNDDDCIIASRWARGSIVYPKQSLFRRVASRSFNLLVRAMISVKFSDTQCGAKILRRGAYEAVAESVETADFAFDVDLLFQLRRFRKIVREVPTVWSDCLGSSLKATSAIPRMLASLVRLRVRHSPLRLFIPAIDRMLDLKPIATRNAIKILVLSPNDPDSSDATVTERSIRARSLELEHFGRSFTWHHRHKHRLPIALAYLLTLRDRFDCVIEIADNGLFWTPFYCLKPKLVFTTATSLPYPYRSAQHIKSVPDSAVALDRAILSASHNNRHLIMRRADGSWFIAESANGQLPAQFHIEDSERYKQLMSTARED